MTEEDKKLLLQDLCARLPYNVKVVHVLRSTIDVNDLLCIDAEKCIVYCDHRGREERYKIEYIKPLLCSMSDMTKEEKEEYRNLCYEEEREQEEFGEWVTRVYYHDTVESIDWLNAHHFDYRGLIERGIAIEVTVDCNPYEL